MVPSRIGERDIVIAENNRVGERAMLTEREEGEKRKSFCFVAVKFELIVSQSAMFLCHLCMPGVLP